MMYIQASIDAINLASKHTAPTPRTSAGIALQDAISLLQGKGKAEDSYNRAMDSLRYSVGIGHRDYARGKRMVGKG